MRAVVVISEKVVSFDQCSNVSGEMNVRTPICNVQKHNTLLYQLLPLAAADLPTGLPPCYYGRHTDRSLLLPLRCAITWPALTWP